MIYFGEWFATYCIIANVLTTVVFCGFCIQTFIYKYSQQDELTTTYSILATIGLIKNLSSCASSYVFTCSMMTDDWATFILLTNWLNFVRIVALFSQMLFLVWRLELTFIRTNYQLSNAGLIFYHVVIVASIILHTIITTLPLDYDTFAYIYYPAQLLRLGVFFGVSYQFMNKLFDLIASQHGSITDCNTPKHTTLMSAVRQNHFGSEDIASSANVNQQLLKELRGELKLLIESQMDNSAFTEKNYQLVSIITKLSFLACIDSITLFVYVAFGEIWTMLLDNNIKIWITFYNIILIIQPITWLIFSLTVWFSFTFAEKQYLCLFGCCHRRFMKYFENSAKKRTIKRQVESLTPSLKVSPIFAASTETPVQPSELEFGVIASS